ncbi:MFS transporter [Cryobacterium sp. Hz7]|uniref:MFS transporter n=1 Tax=Cryobacterium sandaracinum TaxID=1259247 RepID=A0ABY2J8G2_9MICO|nr:MULTISPECIES: MFS transporter [Cryobacterium]TFB59417.1 MFS transporter [Cryobacterium sp. Hz7]TFB60581.1 MFS transporter [Cryobacterium sp. Sr3]TFD01238.1 MFS transporter [Cryobacterium sandaracinum]
MTFRRTVPAWQLAAPALFVMAWGGNHFTPLLHMYESLGHYSVVMTDLFLGFYVVGLVPGLLLAGALSDRYGRKPLTLAGVVLGILASILLGLGFSSGIMLSAGRLLAGLSVAVAMAVGTAWLKELSSPPFDNQAGRTAGARRPSLTLTVGFGLGAGVAGVLAQWGPMPTLSPYVVHIVLSLLVLPRLLRAPETVPRYRAHRPFWQDLAVPLAGHRRFVRVIIPSAPWVFGAAGIAYAIMPTLVQDQLGSLNLAYATLLTVVTLGTGALVQPQVARINRVTDGRALMVGMSVMLLGVGLSVATAIVLSPVLAFLTAVVLGAAYGVSIVAGLVEIQKISTAADLAGITGVYYSLTYIGFLLPVAFAWLNAVAGYPVLLSILFVVCALCLALVANGMRRRVTE